MISSPQNSKIKWVRKLVANARFRRAEGVFVVEGVRMAEEALAAGWLPSLVLFSDDLSKRGKQLVHNYRASSVVEEVSEAVMRSVSDTDTPQGILVVVEEQKLPLPQALDFVLIPDLVRDPGNMGAILRSAAAAGVQAVLIPPKTIDPFTPKVVRSAMGAHFRLPLLDLTWDDIEDLIMKNSLSVLLASAESGVVYTQSDMRRPVALLIGGEAGGASERATGLVTENVTIPMQAGVESLNASAAAAILMYEIVRQRKTAPAA